MVSGLEVGRPLKVVPFPWTLVGRAGFVGTVGLAGRAGVVGLVVVRLVPHRFAVAWSMDVATVGVRSSRPAARSLAS